MAKQLQQPFFTDNDFMDAKKPSFLARFIFVVLGLGILTVIGVFCYTATTKYTRNLSEVKPAKTTLVEPNSQAEPAADDGLEPMVAPPATAPVEETPLSPVVSPYQTPQAVLQSKSAADSSSKPNVSQAKNNDSNARNSAPEATFNGDTIPAADHEETDSASPTLVSESPLSEAEAVKPVSAP